MDIQPYYDILTALLYVRDHPGVPPVVFVKAHAPIGNVLWTELFAQGYLRIDTENRLSLTSTGENLLATLDAPIPGS